MNGGLLTLAGHAIYQGGVWHGGHQGEDRLYEAHVRDAFRIFVDEGYEALALSGGRSRLELADQVSNSEAEGMAEWARVHGIVWPRDSVLLERYGRDSFENLFFSMLCFHRQFGEWPSRVGAVSWKFKALRFYLIACGLRLAEGRFRFYGSGDPAGQPGIEEFASASVRYDATIVRGGEIVDPLHRDPEWFGAKRLARTPREFPTNEDYLNRVKQEYGHADLIDQVDSLGLGPQWRDVNWPWSP